METSELRQVLSELDEFVATQLPFDQLTEFIVDVAEAVRRYEDVGTSSVIMRVLEAYRSSLASGEPGLAGGVDRVSEGMEKST